jgi:hypothetical protein
MPNYWLAIMAVAFAAALAVWIGIVFRADRHPSRRAQDSSPHREVMGGAFEAREGGRQLMPDPGAALVPEETGRRTGQAAEQVTVQEAPGQGATAVPRQAPARGDRP